MLALIVGGKFVIVLLWYTYVWSHFYLVVQGLVLGDEVAVDPETGAEVVLVQGPVLAPVPGPSLPETGGETAVDRAPGMGLSRGTLTHAASLQLGNRMIVPIHAASPGAHLLKMTVFIPPPQIEKGALRLIPAAPPLPREVAMRTNSVNF